jgi:hypothetical protein
VEIFHLVLEGIQLIRKLQGLQQIRTTPKKNDNEEGELFNT